MKTHLLIKNIKTLFSGQGFLDTQGRRPRFADLARFKNIDVRCELETGTITDVAYGLKADSSDDLFDASDLLATPAWIDSHTHTLFDGERSLEFFKRWAGESYQSIAASGGGIHNTVRATQKASDETLKSLVFSRLQEMVLGGTGYVEVKTGYSDTADDELRFLRLLKSIRSELKKSKKLPLISPTFLGLHAIPQGKIEYDFVQEMIGILPIIQKESLADHIDAFPERGFFSLESSLDFARSAATLGIGAKAHCDEITDLRSSEYFIGLGARSIDHLQKINKTAIALLGESSTVATLMPATSFYLGIEYSKARTLINAGACVALATDFNPGTAPSLSMSFTQMLAAKELKMDPQEIFAASTFNAAKALGVEKSVGVVAPKKLANLNFYKAEKIEELFFTSLKPNYVIQRSNRLNNDPQ